MQTPQRTETARFAGGPLMELAGLEPATSWVRCGHAQHVKRPDLLGVSLDSSPLTDLVGRSVRRDFSGGWSALRDARTSGGVAATAAPPSSEHDCSGEVTSRS
jgi:hypothetical protein